MTAAPRRTARRSRDREPTSQSVEPCRSSVTAASVRPSGEKASALTSPPSREGAPRPASGSRASQSAMPCSLSPTAISRPSGLKPPRVAVEAGRGERPVVRERERPPEPAVAREIPGDRRPVVTRRVERLPVGAEDGLLDGARVAAQRLAGRRRADIPEGHRPVEVRRHDRLAVRAEQQPVRAPGEIAGCRLAPLPCARR